MEFIKELQEKYNISEEDLSPIQEGIQKELTTKLADEKKTFEDSLKEEYEGKANRDFEGIFNGAITPLAEKFGFRNRAEKERAGNYLEEFKNHFESKLSEKEKEILSKGEGYALEFKEKEDGYLKKIAELEPFVEYKSKLEEVLTEKEKLTIDTAFASVKPSFDPNADEYAVDGRWKEVKKDVLNKYNLEQIEGEWMAVDKENKYKAEKLKDVISGYDTLNSIIHKGREQKGLGTKNVNTGGEIPFDIPEGATKSDAYAMSYQYLMSKGLNPASPKWDSEYGKLTEKVKKFVK